MKMIKDVAEELGIAIETLRLWCRTFRLDIARDEKNQRLFTDENVEILKKISYWKSEKKLTVEQIQEKLPLEYPHIYNKEEVKQTNQVTDLEALKEIIKSELDPILDLSEKYSRATYEIGSLTAQLEAEKQKTLLIQESSAEYHTSLKETEAALEKYRTEAELARVELVKADAELKDRERQNQQLQEKLSEMENKMKLLEEHSSSPWYKKIFKTKD